MDNPGWHAYRRAKKENERYATPVRGQDGKFLPAEPQALPMNESFIGGFHPLPSPAPPTLPPKDYFPRPSKDTNRPSVINPSELRHLSPIERSAALSVARMQPHLQIMVGPLLRYDTVDEDGVWHGAAMVVTADSGSIYDPCPKLAYHWDSEISSPTWKPQANQNGKAFDLGPHPADPHSTTLPAAAESIVLARDGPSSYVQVTDGQEFYVYAGNGGTYTFWRFPIKVPLTHSEMCVRYGVNNGQQLEFFVPARDQNMRCAAYSCNGFSAGVDTDDFRGRGFNTGYDPLWVDLLNHHARTPFHVLVGGGDQIYCDSLTREPELQEWVKAKADQRINFPLTDEISEAIDRFYFNHYCQHFRSGAFARANSSIPMMNMTDDHDLIDGFGSYPEELQVAPVFRTIGSKGYFFYLLFQCFINVEMDGQDDSPGKHWNKSVIIGDMGPYIPSPSHSFLGYIGPKSYLLMLDCRAERRKDRICSPLEYDKVFKRLHALPQGVEHVVVQLGVPIAYPRMVFLESALDSKFNPLVALGRSGSLGLTGFVNKFNADAELLDDLNDHWTAKGHKKERNWFVEELQKLALARKIRVSFISGDVHCAAVGLFKSLRQKGTPEVKPAQDYRYMLNVTSSAIVNTPPPNPVITLVSSLAGKTHKTMHHVDTDEIMVPLFATDTDGSSRRQKFIMGRRNWCIMETDSNTGEMIFDVRVEKVKGEGNSVGYSIRSPRPEWTQ